MRKNIEAIDQIEPLKCEIAIVGLVRETAQCL